jgi:hypothetical protein
MHEAIDANLNHAVEVYIYLGQVIAMPALADAPRKVRQARPEEGGPPSFLYPMIQAYPPVARPRGSALSDIGGGLLGGAVIDELLGDGGGGWVTTATTACSDPPSSTRKRRLTPDSSRATGQEGVTMKEPTMPCRA